MRSTPITLWFSDWSIKNRGNVFADLNKDAAETNFIKIYANIDKWNEIIKWIHSNKVKDFFYNGNMFYFDNEKLAAEFALRFT